MADDEALTSNVDDVSAAAPVDSSSAYVCVEFSDSTMYNLRGESALIGEGSFGCGSIGALGSAAAAAIGPRATLASAALWLLARAMRSLEVFEAQKIGL